MKQNMGRLIRYILIIHKLSGNRKYIPGDELISYLNLQMELRGYEIGMSLRTLQRDLKDIADMFDVEIRNYRGYGYYIAYRPEDTDIRYRELLMNFDLLTSMNQNSQSVGFIIPEHHRQKGSDSIPALISAIKRQKYVEFDYILVRKGDKLISRKVKPYFLKESLGLWYLLALDEHDSLKAYGIDRMRNINVVDKTFKRSDSIGPDNLFKHSYGIWDDPSMPVEEIELSYSPLDGKFLKTTPLHSSQKVLVDNDTEFRISLQLKITNDFVMALLSRSASLTVIRPLSLRERVREIYKNAIERNN
ncbi:MAG: WYL domain-containing protein [Muribaculaceae bacterium]|nr:WYL domain-containing protein [Muribaculaceae bacterium]